MPTVQLAGISKRFGDVWALRSSDLTILRGEFFALLGSSGSGKTTTLRIIAGFEEPTTGSVRLQGVDVTGHAPYERNVNTVFQDYALFPHMSVAENVGYGLRVRRVARAERKLRVDDALALVRLTGFRARKPSQLSGGQRQRVALARALVNVPAVLLLDEPLGALDLKLRREMQAELKRIQRDVGITFLYVTHDQDEAMSMADRIAVMSDGQIVQIGAPADVYERPASAFVAGFVGVSNLISGIGGRSSGGIVTVIAPGWDRLHVPASSSVAEGEPVVMTVRPEKLTMTLHPPTSEAPNLVRGRVSDVAYGGPFTRYTVTATGGELVVIEQNHAGGPRAAPGEEVWLHWSLEQTYVLPGSGADIARGQESAGQDIAR